MENFVRFAAAQRRHRSDPGDAVAAQLQAVACAATILPQPLPRMTLAPCPWQLRAPCVRTRTLLSGATADAAQIYDACFASATVSFWLDSSRAETGLSRYSYMGDALGPIRCVTPPRGGTWKQRRRP